ncbi:MAG: selenium-dependent xanthine dehydrogenase [Sphaerochaetaceae bacterium]|nr:selenium-dependent xanthine dehydrogenase [Sphaerochaetaceae bacterium]
MTTFTVNGKTVTVDKETRLINYLRYGLHCTSVKDGCTEGACGTCTILIDGKADKACSYVTTEMEGREIITAEGLSEREKNVYTYAFGQAGAVQCGFCIPGMVICAKSLIDVNPDPSEEEIRHAIRNNICRCTGYVKIVEAIRLAAKIFRENLDIKDDVNWKTGMRVPRVDVRDKVTGEGKYPDDYYVENQLNAVAVRSKHPRARVLSIDTSAAEKQEGVFVFTAKDIPGTHKVGHLKRDWDAMIGIGETTHYIGDVIALVAAPTRSEAYKAAELVKVEYEILPFVSDPYQAMAENAPLVHEEGNLLGETHVDRGDAHRAIENSQYKVSGHFRTPWTEHAFMEPECAFAFPLENGGVKIVSSDQSVYDTRRETSPMLNLPEEMVVVENAYVGGGFGGKEDVSVQHYAALVAYLTKRPCKMKLTREESLIVHPKRHPMDIEMSIGCDENGIIQGLEAKIIADTGAYASLGIPVLQRACTHASGPYNYTNFKIDGYAWYTNNPPAGAFRGFGVTQSCFAVETLINRLADMAGIDHWKMRYINAIHPGQSLPNGQIADESTGLVETLDAVKDIFYGSPNAGIACAMKNAGVGVGLPDYGRVRLEIVNGKTVIHCGGSCIGQGMCTVLKQIVCDITGLDGNSVVEEKANSQTAPDSGTTSGSRHTTVTGEAVRRASVMLKAALNDVNGDIHKLEGREFYAEYLAETDPFGSNLPHPKSHVAYGYATHVCILDTITHRVKKIAAAHDVGYAVNPLNVEGQIEGGVVMGLGFAVRENFPVKNCIPTAKFGSLGLFRADEVPEIQAIIVEKPGLNVAGGAIGIGEITAIPTAPAISDAYYRLDGQMRNSLPLTDTPYCPSSSKGLADIGARSLTINPKARCIGCKECVRACAMAFHKTEQTKFAYLQVRNRRGTGNQSGISGIIVRPVVCIQCGTCARACSKRAITKNRFGTFTVDKMLCDGCGDCIEVCPLDILVREDNGKVTKCIACGICAKACPTNVISIVN